MSLDKFVSRGFTASTGGGMDSWVAKASTATAPNTTAPSSGGSGTSFVLGGGSGARAGSSRAGEALGSRSSAHQSRSGLTRGGAEGKSSGDAFERRSFSEDLIVSLFPQCDPRFVLSVLVVLGLSAAGYLFMQVAGFAQDDDGNGYGRSVQSEISDRRNRLR